VFPFSFSFFFKKRKEKEAKLTDRFGGCFASLPGILIFLFLLARDVLLSLGALEVGHKRVYSTGEHTKETNYLLALVRTMEGSS
jgi:hypothetical protein